MTATKQIMTALWRARQAAQQQHRTATLADAFRQEFYRRGWPAAAPEQYKEGGGWITIGGGPAVQGGRRVQHAGGTPVQVDGQGNIRKGPADLKGTHVSDPGQPRDETPEERDARMRRQEARRTGGVSPKPEPRAGAPKGPPEIPPAGTPKTPARESRAEAQSRLRRQLGRRDTAQVGETQIQLRPTGNGQYTANLTAGGRTVQAAAAGTREQAVSAAVEGALRQEFPDGPASTAKAVKPPAESGEQQQQTMFPGIAPAPAKKPKVTPAPEEQGRLIPKGPAEEAPVAAQPYPTDAQGRIQPYGEALRTTPPPGVKVTRHGRWVGNATLHADDVEMDPARFQYKMEVGEEGVSETLKEVRQFDPLYGGVVQVWRDPADGKTYVINGHHRMELAKRSPHKDADPDDPDDWSWHGEMQVRYINAGNERQARAIGALVNIAEGHGTALDAASYMKESGIKAKDLRKHNISLKGKVAEVAAALSDLSPKLFSMVHSKVWSEKRGVIFGKHLPGDERKQDELATYVRDKEEDRKRPFTDEEVEEMAFAKSWATETTEEQETLWGKEEKRQDTFAEEAEIANQAKKSFAGVLRKLSGVSSEAAKAIIEGTGVGKIETRKAKEETARARDLFDAFQRERKYKGPLRDALAEAALGYKNDPRNRDQYVGQFLERAQGILEAIQRGGKDGDPGGGGDRDGGGPASEAAEPAAEWETRGHDPSVKEMFRREMNYRRVCERYAKLVAVREIDDRKIEPIRTNYRPAFGWVRCAACRFRQGTGCQQVRGPVKDEDVCDLFAAEVIPDPRVYPERYAGRWDESKHKRGNPKTGNKGQFAPKGAGAVGGGGEEKPSGESHAQTSDPSDESHAPQQPQQPTAQPAAQRPGVAALKPEHEQPPQIDPQSVQRADALLAQPPASPEAWQQTWAAIERHPYYQEVNARMASYADDSPDGNVMEWSRGKHTDQQGNYTPERKAVHREILGKLLNPNAKAKPGQKPIAVFLMGPPAAGKTTAGAPLTKRLGVEFTTINPDDVKEMLPEYRGWNAGLLHEESSEVAEGFLQEQAVRESHNLLFDITGKNGEKVTTEATKLQAAGYDVHVVNVAADDHVVGWRAWQRFRRQALGDQKGRFVPPKYAAEAVDGKPKRTFEAMKQHPAVKGWLSADTSGFERGEGARVIEEGGR